MAFRMGLVPGMAFDLTTADSLGEFGGLSRPEKREEALRIPEKEQPVLVAGSPMCTKFHRPQSLSRDKRTQTMEELDQGLEDARPRVRLSIEIYTWQLASGRFFLHERPHSATSWKMEGTMGANGA